MRAVDPHSYNENILITGMLVTKFYCTGNLTLDRVPLPIAISHHISHRRPATIVPIADPIDYLCQMHSRITCPIPALAGAAMLPIKLYRTV